MEPAQFRKPFGLFLNRQRVLLIDTEVRDEILFAHD
jgi:hypothetical protein